MSIGERIKARLSDLNMKHIDLVNELKISKSTLSGYISGYREPDLDTIKKLAASLHTSVEYLITGNEDLKENKASFSTTSDEKEALKIALIKANIIPVNRDLSDDEYNMLFGAAKGLLESKND